MIDRIKLSFLLNGHVKQLTLQQSVTGLPWLIYMSISHEQQIFVSEARAPGLEVPMPALPLWTLSVSQCPFMNTDLAQIWQVFRDYFREEIPYVHLKGMIPPCLAPRHFWLSDETMGFLKVSLNEGELYLRRVCIAERRAFVLVDAPQGSIFRQVLTLSRDLPVVVELIGDGVFKSYKKGKPEAALAFLLVHQFYH